MAIISIEVSIVIIIIKVNKMNVMFLGVVGFITNIMNKYQIL